VHADAASAERCLAGSGKDLYRQQPQGLAANAMKKAARRKPGGFSGTAKAD
jgi:hypothetical protein